MIMPIFMPLLKKYLKAGMTEAWNVRVEGRVQGVGFRYSARRKADLLGLTGWVRNDYDGSVVLFVQGKGSRVAKYLHWLSQGPSMATVTNLVKVPSSPDEELISFEIRY